MTYHSVSVSSDPRKFRVSIYSNTILYWRGFVVADLYYVYEDPTYRNALELCLRPFAGQIFQSRGSLHIRRAVSLYNDSRPLSFYEVGVDFPQGWLMSTDGKV